MKKLLLALSIAISAIVVIKLTGQEKSLATFISKPDIIYKVNDIPTIPQVSRIGVNLGKSTTYGTSQFGNNILQNPGLESQVDQHLVIVSQSDEESFSDEAGWGYPNSQWNNAEFLVRTGKSAGKKGVIKNSLTSGNNGFPQYFTQQLPPQLEPGDIVILKKINHPHPPDFWSTRFLNRTSTDPTTSRTHSNGTQSFKLSPTKNSRADIFYLLDTNSTHSGKGIRVNGDWQFRFWAKAAKSNGELKVIFERQNGTKPFIQTILELTTEWQEYVIDFTGDDSGAPGNLQLSIIAFHPNNSIWIDDLFLGKHNQQDTPFRPEVVNALRELSPSFIREFPALSDTLENRLASPYARKAMLQRFAGGGGGAKLFSTIPYLNFYLFVKRSALIPGSCYLQPSPTMKLNN